MNSRSPTPDDDRPRSTVRKIRAYAVHVYTASGIIFAFLAAAQLVAE